MKANYPIKFEPNVHTALWGHEEWLVSNHRSGMGVIANGELKGRRLDEVFPDFPLLIKIIDAKTRLSVQVHPNERTSPITGGDPKTEMWCLLNDGFIYAGLQAGVRPDDIARAVGDGRFEELMVRHEGKAGEAYFIPGGMVHAIGDDTRIFEVQQSSDTTYRLYDWGRVDAAGKSRDLHVEEAGKAIDYSLPPPVAAAEVVCPFFSFRKLELAGRGEIAASAAYTVIYAARGALTVNGVWLSPGECVLVPPAMAIELVGDSAALFVVSS